MMLQSILRIVTGEVINNTMKVSELIEGREQDVLDWQASTTLCKSSKPDSALGASALASCKSQGLRRRDGKKSHKVGKKRVTVGGKKLKGQKYGGPLKDYS